MKNSTYEWNDVIRELTEQDGGIEKFLDELIEINENSDSPIIVDTRVTVDVSSYGLTEYERGYGAALKQIKRNLEHMCKGMWSVEMYSPFGFSINAEDLDRYEGESECYSFLLEELNLDKV